MPLTHLLLFASDATMLLIAGGVLLLVSLLALLGERRRRRRRDIDAVGLVPWRDVAALTLFAGLVLVALAVPALLKG